MQKLIGAGGPPPRIQDMQAAPAPLKDRAKLRAGHRGTCAGLGKTAGRPRRDRRDPRGRRQSRRPCDPGRRRPPVKEAPPSSQSSSPATPVPRAAMAARYLVRSPPNANRGRRLGLRVTPERILERSETWAPRPPRARASSPGGTGAATGAGPARLDPASSAGAAAWPRGPPRPRGIARPSTRDRQTSTETIDIDRNRDRSGRKRQGGRADPEREGGKQSIARSPEARASRSL